MTFISIWFHLIIGEPSQKIFSNFFQSWNYVVHLVSNNIQNTAVSHEIFLAQGRGLNSQKLSIDQLVVFQNSSNVRRQCWVMNPFWNPYLYFDILKAALKLFTMFSEILEITGNILTGLQLCLRTFLKNKRFFSLILSNLETFQLAKYHWKASPDNPQKIQGFPKHSFYRKISALYCLWGI